MFQLGDSLESIAKTHGLVFMDASAVSADSRGHSAYRVLRTFYGDTFCQKPPRRLRRDNLQDLASIFRRFPNITTTPHALQELRGGLDKLQRKKRQKPFYRTCESLYGILAQRVCEPRDLLVKAANESIYEGVTRLAREDERLVMPSETDRRLLSRAVAETREQDVALLTNDRALLSLSAAFLTQLWGVDGVAYKHLHSSGFYTSLFGPSFKPARELPNDRVPLDVLPAQQVSYT